MSPNVSRVALVIAATALLGGCGFHLRQSAALPQGMDKVHLTVVGGGRLERELSRAIENSNATVMDKPGAGIAELAITSNTFRTDSLTVSGTARVTEYAVRYHVDFNAKARMARCWWRRSRWICRASSVTTPPTPSARPRRPKNCSAASSPIWSSPSCSACRRPATTRPWLTRRPRRRPSKGSFAVPMQPAQWQKHLAGDRMAPVYLLVGEELLVLEAADALRAMARRLGYSEREVLEADSRFDWDDLARSSAGLSLFATQRLLDLRLAGGRAGKEGGAAISEFVGNPPPDTTLLISATEWSSKHEAAWTKNVDQGGIQVVFNAPRPNEWGQWIGQRLTSRGLQATPDAVAMLAERVEGNLLAAAQEIDKLVVLAGGRRLDAATLEGLVADSARFDAFKLTDAAFAGEGGRALRILAGLHAEGEELIALMGWLVNQLQLALRLANARDFSAQAKAERLWPAREQLFRKALRRAPREHWMACLARAARIDRMAKGREQGDPWLEAERLIAAIAEPRAAAAFA